MTFCDNLLKSFSKNLKQLIKMNDFLLFLRFHENRRILHFFQRRYEFCMQKYLVSVYLLNFHRRHNFGWYQRLLPYSADFLKNLKISNFALFVFFSI